MEGSGLKYLKECESRVESERTAQAPKLGLDAKEAEVLAERQATVKDVIWPHKDKLERQMDEAKIC